MLKQETIAEALNEVEWPGRLQRIDEDPPTLIDCAHNPMGAQALTNFLQDIGWEQNVVLFTAMKDKKIEPMLQAIAAQTGALILTRIEPFARCAPLDQLKEAANKAGLAFQTDEQIETALPLAQNLARHRNLPLVIFGSIYLIGEILKRKGTPATAR